jgi:ribosomal protein S12 methylthiotransferase
MAQSQKLCRYLDMPLQHASDAMLTAMRRGITKRRTKDLIQQFRDTIEGLVIRTTFIVGFPGETEKDFEELLDFMREIRFERVGIFQYSNEATAHAATLPGQIDEKVKEDRFHRAMQIQQEISSKNQEKHVGTILKVLVEEEVADKKKTYRGRSYMDAPEVDGAVLFKSARALKAGDFCNVKIEEADPYDLFGKQVSRA